jgi:hypothetical protein
MSLATDEIRNPPYAIRLPPIDRTSTYSRNPRIVYANDLQQKTNPTKRSAPDQFPILSSLSSLRRFENDEPKLRRGFPEHEPEPCSPAPAEASPVHTPKKLTKVTYNKKSNPFGDLVNGREDDSDMDETPMPKQKEQKEQKNLSAPSAPSSSWASIAAGNKSTNMTNNKTVPVVATSTTSQPQQRIRSRFSIVIPTAISAGPLLPPISFKPKPVSSSDLDVKNQQVKKMWGDTDSEDDEEFLKRGVN